MSIPHLHPHPVPSHPARCRPAMPVERLVSEASHDPPSIPTRPSHGAPDSVGPIVHPAVRLVSSQTRRRSRASSARLSRLDAVGGWASTKPPPICWVRVPIIRCTSAVFLLTRRERERVRTTKPSAPMVHDTQAGPRKTWGLVGDGGFNNSLPLQMFADGANPKFHQRVVSNVYISELFHQSIKVCVLQQ